MASSADDKAPRMKTAVDEKAISADALPTLDACLTAYSTPQGDNPFHHVARYLLLLQTPENIQKKDKFLLIDDFFNSDLANKKLTCIANIVILQMILDTRFWRTQQDAKDKEVLSPVQWQHFSQNLIAFIKELQPTHPNLVFRTYMQAFMPDSYIARYRAHPDFKTGSVPTLRCEPLLDISKSINALKIPSVYTVLTATDCDALKARYLQDRDVPAEWRARYSDIDHDTQPPVLGPREKLYRYHPNAIITKSKTFTATTLDLAANSLEMIGFADLQLIFQNISRQFEHISLQGNGLAFLRESRLPFIPGTTNHLHMLFVSRSTFAIARNVANLLLMLKTHSISLAYNFLDCLGVDGVIVILKDLKIKEVNLSYNDFHELPAAEQKRLMDFLLIKKEHDGVEIIFNENDPFHQIFKQYQQDLFYNRLRQELLTPPRTAVGTPMDAKQAAPADAKEPLHAQRLTQFGIYPGNKAAHLVCRTVAYYQQYSSTSGDAKKAEEFLQGAKKSSEMLLKQCPLELDTDLFIKWLQIALHQRFWDLSISLHGKDVLYQTKLAEHIMRVKDHNPQLWQRACVHALLSKQTLLGRIFYEGYRLSFDHPLTAAHSPVFTTILPALQAHQTLLHPEEAALLQLHEATLRDKLGKSFASLLGMFYPEKPTAAAGKKSDAKLEHLVSAAESADVRTATSLLDMHNSL